MRKLSNRRLNRIFSKIESQNGHNKGIGNENLVLQLIQDLHTDGVLPMMSDAYRTKRGSKEDASGIDIVIVTDKDRIYLQVKSSSRAVSSHFKKHGKAIPCIVVENDGSDEKLKLKIRNIIQAQYKAKV